MLRDKATKAKKCMHFIFEKIYFCLEIICRAVFNNDDFENGVFTILDKLIS